MTRHPDNPDAFTLPPTPLPILRRALQSRLNELGRFKVAIAADPELFADRDAVDAEMRAVGAMMEGVGE